MVTDVPDLAPKQMWKKEIFPWTPFQLQWWAEQKCILENCNKFIISKRDQSNWAGSEFW